MTDDYAIRRREYVNEVRKSFEQMDGKNSVDAETDASGFSFVFFKLRCFFAICIFVAFLICSYTNYDFYGIKTEEMIDIISDNHYYTNLRDYVMISLLEK